MTMRFTILKTEERRIILPDLTSLSKDYQFYKSLEYDESYNGSFENPLQLTLPETFTCIDLDDDPYYSEEIICQFYTKDIDMLMKFTDIYKTQNSANKLIYLIMEEVDKKYKISSQWDILTSAPEFFTAGILFRNSFDFVKKLQEKKQKASNAEAKKVKSKKDTPDAEEDTPDAKEDTPDAKKKVPATDYSNFAITPEHKGEIKIGKNGSVQIDLSESIRLHNISSYHTTNRKFFRVLSPSEYRMGDQADLLKKFKILEHRSRKHVPVMFSKIALSSRFHLLLHNEILTIMKDSCYYKVFAYYMFYILYMLRTEEHLLRKSTPKDSRTLHRLDTWQGIQFDNVMGAITNSNVSNMRPVYNKYQHRCYSSIQSTKSAITRFNRITNDVFIDFPFKKFKSSVYGSILLPCVIEMGIESIYSSFDEYIEHLYPSLLSPAKDENNARRTDIDIGITCTPEEYDDLANAFFIELQTRDPHATMIRKHCGYYKGREKYKFILFSPIIMREIDLFMTHFPPHQLIQSFHMPCIRMYYDGDDIQATSECIIALTSRINVSYSYSISQNATVEDILMKYFERGINLMVSYSELSALRKKMSEYNSGNRHSFPIALSIRRTLTNDTRINYQILEGPEENIGFKSGQTLYKVSNGKSIIMPLIHSIE